MERKIDFLKAYKRPISSKKASRGLIIGGVIGTIFYILLVVGVFFFWFFLKKEYEGVSRRVKEKKSQVNQMRKKELLYVLLNQQLNTLVKIRAEKGKDFLQIFPFFFQFQGEEISFEQISISAKREVELKGKAADAFTFAKFLDLMVNSESGNLFSKIILNSLVREEEGSYSFSFSFVYEGA